MSRRVEDVVGLDWSDGEIVAARVDVGPLGAVRLLNAGSACVPVDAAEGEVVAAMRTVWHAAGMPSRTVAVSLRSRSVAVRPFDYPELHPEELRAALRLEAEEALQLPQSEIALDWHVNESGTAASERGARQFSGLLVAAPLREVARYQRMLTLAGLFPVVMELGATAVANLFRATHREPGACDGVCVLHLTGQSADISVLHGKNGLYARTLYARGGSWDSSEQALIEGVNEGLKYFVFKLHGKPVRMVAVTGRIPNQPSFLEDLTARIGVPVRVWEQAAMLHDAPHRVREKLRPTPPASLAIAMGLSLRGYADD